MPLPQLEHTAFLTDGGLETSLIFRQGIDLPHFAAFHLLRDAPGIAALRRYFSAYAALASRLGVGLILDSATWRASADWGDLLGYSSADLAEANRRAIHLLEDVRRKHATERSPMVISGCIGPRGDGYRPTALMDERAAEAYHGLQIEVFADSAAEMVCALTLNYVEEAIGIARAARRAALPVAISFTVETDGRLPTGDTLSTAIREVDGATHAYPAYYMINCAHPLHFLGALGSDGILAERVRGVRANASQQSHAQLNESATLDDGDPVALADDFARLLGPLPQLTILGGCCGTDERHVEQIAAACLPLIQRRHA